MALRPNRTLSIAHHVGTTQADTVVFFCHGAGGNKDQWRPRWQALKAEGYSLVARPWQGNCRMPSSRCWKPAVTS
ncbi:hypothetical protein [Pseudomonas pergaminensis]